MADALVTFASLNQVALLKRALLARGLYLEMQRTPTCLSNKSCGFALRAQPEHLPTIAEECARLKIESNGVYTQEASGDWVEAQGASSATERP